MSKPVMEALGAASLRVAEEQQRILRLQTEVAIMRAEVERAEAAVRDLGDNALTMPEDLGEWRAAGPRVEGLAVRVRQVHALSAAVAKLSAATAQQSTATNPAADG